MSKQVRHVIIVDNNSTNNDIIKDLCSKMNNCETIELKFNAGIVHALRIGVLYAINNYTLDGFCSSMMARY